MDEMAKPVCGSKADGAVYDFSLHVGAVFIVFFASIGGCGFPVVAKKVKWMKIPPKIFFFCKHFGTGVLIATAFVHLLPTAFTSLNDPCLPDLFTDKYPAMPGVIMMGSLFILFVIEMWLNAKTGGHSHGSATGQEFAGGQAPPGIQAAFNNPIRRTDSYDSQKTMLAMRDEKRGWVEDTYPVDKFPLPNTSNDELEARSEMPPWFIVFYEQYVRQRDEMLGMVNRAMPALPSYPQQTTQDITPNSYFEDDVEQAVDPMVLKKQSMQITLIEGGILFHSVFVGMTISITSSGFIVLLIAIVFHQMFEGLGLGSRIAAVPYPSNSWKPWVLVVAFGTTAPIGQAIGLLTRGSYDPNSAFGLIIVGVFNAISSGLLIYAALVDLLAEDFLSEEAQHTLTGRDKTTAFIYVLLGAAGMSVVGAFA
ncbi:Zinc/iron permease [Cucurbitaria berberidis CBS 394.84]|uniref:Zinc/iron permease n=1 Tax=Cucurbitaria berberidis CBS 394.84 TaxID=1168544 RepID=A0A9P4GEY0_9PLEO|nr:Zinc/iron permease [Cucurbitaria berberidis CBS 394.84]KAF1844788.1 Zinc/iron permease [Cucurbitaria berberidis CBS 394.84]